MVVEQGVHIVIDGAAATSNLNLHKTAVVQRSLALASVHPARLHTSTAIPPGFLLFLFDDRLILIAPSVSSANAAFLSPRPRSAICRPLH